MHTIRFYHWVIVLTAAVVFHAAFIWAYPNEKDKGITEASTDAGVVAFEIGLAAETIKQNVTPPEPKPKPVERKVVETKAAPPPKPKPIPVVEPEIESDVAIAPIKEPEPVAPVEEVVEKEPLEQEPLEEVVQQEMFEQVVSPIEEAPQEVRETVVAGGDKGLEKDYQAQLSAWLEKHKSYPRRARQRGQEGTAFLRFKIDSKGHLISHKIETSSGFRLLDKEVEKMLMRALPLPEIPIAMRQSELELILPVSFQLR